MNKKIKKNELGEISFDDYVRFYARKKVKYLISYHIPNDEYYDGDGQEWVVLATNNEKKALECYYLVVVLSQFSVVKEIASRTKQFCFWQLMDGVGYEPRTIYCE